MGWVLVGLVVFSALFYGYLLVTSQRDPYYDREDEDAGDTDMVEGPDVLLQAGDDHDLLCP